MPDSNTYLIAIFENTGGKERPEDISHRCTGTPESKHKTPPAEGKNKKGNEGSGDIRNKRKMQHLSEL